MKRHQLRIIATLLGGVLSVALPVRAELTLGIHPFKPPSKLLESFAPLASYLGEKMGEPVVIRIAKDYQTHIDAVGRDEVDMAYLGPVPYVKLRRTYGFKPLLARQQIGDRPVFHGKIFVRQDSPIRNLADIKGKRFAFGEAHSTMSHLVPRYMLSQAGITADQLAEYRFIGDHLNVALAVLSGDYDAGAVKEDVFYQYEARGLRAIATSEPFSDHMFVASSKLPEAQVAKLRNALLQLDREPNGNVVLQSITRGITALVPVKDSDYDGLRRVLNKLRELGVDG